MRFWVFTVLIPFCTMAVVSGCESGSFGAPSHVVVGANPTAQFLGRKSLEAASTGISGDLLYASSYNTKRVLIFSYPQGKQVGQLTGFPAALAGLCSDPSGNVYVTTQGNGESLNESYVYKYAHGETTPTAMLTDPGLANGCAVDSLTGHIAIANNNGPGGANGDIAVYQSMSSPPTIYTDPNVGIFLWCTYDDRGNLFADGGSPSNIVDELPSDSNDLLEITLSKSINPASISWARKQLAIASGRAEKNQPQVIYGVKVSGSIGRVNRSTTLSTPKNKSAQGEVQVWLQGSTAIAPGSGHRRESNGLLYFWEYPKGGMPTKTLVPRGRSSFYGVTVSVGDGGVSPRE
ncbi:MAG: hypothetical protein JOZ77_08775 [Candidatus Eremiobacteraeota bacterium]|nr:hypothetical protein [Candidatus Eremiobacteraeota bacterium]